LERRNFSLSQQSHLYPVGVTATEHNTRRN
jgi:hypothetical protein